jgi:hypothetical protein
MGKDDLLKASREATEISRCYLLLDCCEKALLLLQTWVEHDRIGDDD